MARKPSIGKKMRSTHSQQTRRRRAAQWLEEWKGDQTSVIRKFDRAVRQHDHGDIMHMIDHMQAITEKRFIGLETVAKAIGMDLDSDRIQEWRRKQYSAVIRLRRAAEDDMHAEMARALSSIKKMTDDNFNVIEVEIAKVTALAPPDQAPDPVPTEIPPAPGLPEFPPELDVPEIVAGFKCGMSIAEMAATAGTSGQKIIKILVTEGVYTSNVYDRIKEMRQDGMTDPDISKTLGIALKTLNMYTPYTKGAYKSSNASPSALAQRACRAQQN